MNERMAPDGAGRGEAFRRALVTVAGVAVVAGAQRIPVPFLDPQALQLLPGGGLPALSIAGLGLAPFLSAFVVVECAALLVPGLRRLRHGSFRDRAPLTGAAWALALLFSAVQACGIVQQLAAYPNPLGTPMLEGGAFTLVLVALTLVAGGALLALAAAAMGRYGLGNGFAILMVAQGTFSAVWDLRALGSGAALDQPAPTGSDAFMMVLVIALGAALAVRVVRGTPGASPTVPVPTCGLVPLQVTATVLLIPAVLSAWIPSVQSWAEVLHAGAFEYQLCYVGLALALALLLARLFCGPAAVAAAWAAVGSASEQPEREDAVRRALALANKRSIALLVGIAAMPLLTLKLRMVVQPRSLLVAIVVAAAVVLDLVAEVRARGRHRDLVAAYPLHRVYAADPVLAALAAAGIPAHARSRSFRALYHFFAPFVPIEVLVPADRVEEAEAICARVAQAAAARGPRASPEPVTGA